MMFLRAKGTRDSDKYPRRLSATIARMRIMHDSFFIKSPTLDQLAHLAGEINDIQHG